MIYLPKSPEVPACLAYEKTLAKGSHNCGDVLDRLRADFKNKCYICECSEPHVINTEHLEPHEGDKNKRFDWSNLFYACGHCNNIKGNYEAYNPILNCTLEEDNVETSIKYLLDPFPKEKAQITALVNNEKVNKSVALLLAVYNGTTKMKQIESANLRKSLLVELKKFQDMLIDYYREDYLEEEKEKIKGNILRELRNTSGFTAFKRWIIRARPGLLEDFGEYLTDGTIG